MNGNYPKVNVAAEERDPGSVLNYFRKLIAFRKANRGLIYGDYKLLDEDNLFVYSYLREGAGQRFLIMLNFTPKPAVARIGLESGDARIVVNNYGQEGMSLKENKRNYGLSRRSYWICRQKNDDRRRFPCGEG